VRALKIDKDQLRAMMAQCESRKEIAFRMNVSIASSNRAIRRFALAPPGRSINRTQTILHAIADGVTASHDIAEHLSISRHNASVSLWTALERGLVEKVGKAPGIKNHNRDVWGLTLAGRSALTQRERGE